MTLDGRSTLTKYLIDEGFENDKVIKAVAADFERSSEIKEQYARAIGEAFLWAIGELETIIENMEDREGMSPREALEDCYDSWGSGSWDERNAAENLAEVMKHLSRLFDEQEN